MLGNIQPILVAFGEIPAKIMFCFSPVSTTEARYIDLASSVYLPCHRGRNRTGDGDALLPYAGE